MTYEELVRSVEAAAAQKNNEILQRAQKEADEILREAEADAGKVKDKYLHDSLKRAQIERNRQIYLTSEEIKATHTNIARELFFLAFKAAEERLRTIRETPGYPEMFRKLYDEARMQAGRGEHILHISDLDSDIGTEISSDVLISGLEHDLNSSGGIILKSRDMKITILNTVESRLEKAQDLYKLEIFKALTGE